MYSKRRHRVTVLSKDDKSACVLRLVDVLSVVNFEPCVECLHILFTQYSRNGVNHEMIRGEIWCCWRTGKKPGEIRLRIKTQKS